MPKEVDYTNPPINEVVFGAIFKRLSEFKIAHFGKFWAKIQQDFPATQDQLPVLSQGEVYDFDNSLLRVWFLSDDNCKLLQVQQNRFHFNWRRTEETSKEYPEYTSIRPEFLRYFADFQDFLRSDGIEGNLEISELELSYINIISEDDIKPALGRLGDVFVDHRRLTSGSRFLPEADNFSWTSVYKLPEELGVLTIDAKTAYRVGQEDSKVAQLSLTVRGNPAQQKSDSLQDWFDRAHNQIVKGFSDFTDSGIQQSIWKRK